MRRLGWKGVVGSEAWAEPEAVTVVPDEAPEPGHVDDAVRDLLALADLIEQMVENRQTGSHLDDWVSGPLAAEIEIRLADEMAGARSVAEALRVDAELLTRLSADQAGGATTGGRSATNGGPAGGRSATSGGSATDGGTVEGP